MRGCNVCLVLKAVRHKPYGNLQSLLVPTYCWKDLSIDFVISLSILTDWKRDSYNSILVIVNWLTKIVHYKPVKVTIDALPDSIVTNRRSLFTSKFWLLLCYFLGIKQRLSITFRPQPDGQTKRQNSTMEAYL